MNITHATVTFWEEYSQKTPKWMEARRARKPRISIDGVINSQAGISMTDAERSCNNTLCIIKGYRNRGDYLPIIQQMALHPGTVINPEKRAALCKRLEKRILRLRKVSHDN